MKEWVRRNSLEGLAVMFLSLSMVGVYLNIMDARTAHPQKLGEQPIPSGFSFADSRRDHLVALYDDLPKWIEQHCVAIPECDHGSAEAKCGLSGPLKIRCTRDQEGGK